MSWIKHIPQIVTESSGHNSNPAESVLSNLSHRLSQQEQNLPLVMEQLSAANQRYQQLETLVRQIHETLSQTNHPPQPSVPPSAASTSVSPSSQEQASPMERTHFRVAPSPQTETFGGEFEDCNSFLLQCKLAFERSPSAFISDSAKISYIVGLLRGRALMWAEAKSHDDSFLQGPYNAFLSDFKLTFGRHKSVSDIRKKLWTLSQGKRTVADLAVDFRILAARTTWNEDALILVFTEALSDKVRNQLALCPEPSALEELIRLAMSIDKRQRELSRHAPVPAVAATHDQNSCASNRLQPDTEEPMQMGRTRLTQEEREHCQRSGLCLYCGTAGHFVNSCPKQPKGRARWQSWDYWWVEIQIFLVPGVFSHVFCP
uniref:CCHC-type domain-containing protein n=1 Tax=Nothobranchius furzeri TaxID=105023 RepID=A0A8C6L166_NOTFU